MTAFVSSNSMLCSINFWLITAATICLVFHTDSASGRSWVPFCTPSAGRGHAWCCVSSKLVSSGTTGCPRRAQINYKQPTCTDIGSSSSSHRLSSACFSQVERTSHSQTHGACNQLIARTYADAHVVLGTDKPTTLLCTFSVLVMLQKVSSYHGEA